MASKIWSNTIKRELNAKLGERVSILDFGAAGDGVTDDAPAFARFIDALQTRAAGVELYLPGGYQFLLKSSVTIPAGVPSFSIAGDGVSSVILRGANLAAGTGLFDVYASDILLADFLIDGQVLTPTKLQYNVGFTGVGPNDPLAASLTTNSSIWIHDAVSGFRMDGLTIQHTGGYAVLVNAVNNDILDIDIRHCWFVNNRPFLFGTTLGQLDYGSWGGGVMLHGDGRVGAPWMVRGLNFRENHFRRCTGNGFWTHLYGNSSFHERIVAVENDGLDMGLDFIQYGGVMGGAISNNVARRVGYICLDDASPSVPKYLNGLFASGIDHSYLCISVDVVGNTLISCNGDYINLDGFGYGNICANTCRTPWPTDPEYVEDLIATSGWGGSGSPGGPNFCHGILLSNSFDTPQAGLMVCIVGNTLINCGAGAIGLFASRQCVARSNNIWHAADAPEAPIILGTIGTSANQRTYDTMVHDNFITYDPTTAQPAIYEHAYAGAFDPTDQNHIFGNVLINPVHGASFEFQADAGAASTTRQTFNSNFPALTAPSYHFVQREQTGNSGVLRWYFGEGVAATAAIHMQLQTHYTTGVLGPLLNISVNGGALTGSITTGSRVTTFVPDIMATGKLYADGFAIFTDATYADADADLLSSTYGLIRFKAGVGHFEQSITTSSGVRVWTALSGGGSVAGSNTQVQYNNSGAFGASANFTFASNILTVLTGVVTTTFNSSATGSTNAVQQVSGNFTITGAGNAAFQSCVVTSTFNSLATGSTAAVQQNTGTFVITGAGNASFQGLALTNALAVAYGGTGLTAVPGSSTQLVFNNGGVYSASANLTFASNILTALTGMVTQTFNSSATGSTNAVQQVSGNFTITGAGNASFQSCTVTNALTSNATGTNNCFSSPNCTINGNGAITTDICHALTYVMAGSTSIAGTYYVYDASFALQTGYTGTVASAAGRNVVGGIIV